MADLGGLFLNESFGAGSSVAAAAASLGATGSLHTVLSGGSIQAAINGSKSGDAILVGPGTYVEAVVIPKALTGLVIMGVGPRLAAAVAPSGSNKTALTCNSDDVTVVNMDFAGTGTGSGVLNTGRRFYGLRCKFEGDGTANGTGITLKVGQDANIHVTEENGSDTLLEDCEYAWADIGVLLKASDYGACTQNRIRGGVFHNLATASVKESTGTGGSASITYRNLEITDASFDKAEDGTNPTKWLDLNASNSNTGIISGCRFPVAINSGLNLLSTKLIMVGSYFTGGINAAQPS